MSLKTADGKYVVFAETWTESEAGWGQRPDGYIYHISKDHRDRYVRAYWDRMPKALPQEYSRPDENLFPTLVDEETFKKIEASKDGMWGPDRKTPKKWEG